MIFSEENITSIISRIEATSKNNDWSLYFQFGTGCCEICDGTVTFKSSKVDIVGCLAIVTVKRTLLYNINKAV